MYKISLSWLTVVFCLVLLTACGGGGSSSEPSIKSPGGAATSGGGSTGGDSGSSGSSGIVKIGNGTGSSFVESTLAASNTNLQAGASTDIVVNLVDANSSAIGEEAQVSFASDCVSNALASFSASSVETSAGRASVTYNAQGCSGTDTVTATALVQGLALQASVDLTIAPDQVLALNFVSAEPEQLALKGMGNGESSRVTFELVGEQGAPIRNELITFSLSTTAGGVSLAPDSEGDPTRETVTSDNSGLASVVVRSGTVATTIRVIATHNSTGIQATSAGLVVSTGVPVHSKFSLSYSPQAPAEAYGTDGIPVSVSVIASDQFGNDAFDGTQISFWSPESGNIDSSCVLESGRCTVSWISAGVRPDDGRATFIAYTDGAEDFTDLNGNNVFDDGEAWHNISEAYADHNENGTRDDGEYFVDSLDTDPPRGVAEAWDAEPQLPFVWDGPCLSDFCPGQPSVKVWRDYAIIMSLPKADLFAFTGTRPSAENCTTPLERELVEPTPFELATDANPADTIYLASDPVTIPSLYVSDSRERSLLPCHILGNPMASGTKIEFSTDNGEIQGNSSWTVPDRVNHATLIGPLTLKRDDTPDSGTLTLTITPAGIDPPTIFTWQVDD